MDAYLDKAMRGWLHKVARRNYYKIAGYEFDDLLQEGYLCYHKCHSRYVGKGSTGYCYRGRVTKGGRRLRHLPEDPAEAPFAKRHLMQLVQVAFMNRIATLAHKYPAGLEVDISELVTDQQTVEQAWEAIIPAEAEVASAAMLLQSAPKEIKQLFDLLISDGLSGYRRFGGRWRNGKQRLAARETNNQRFCRLLGLAPDFDMVGLVNKHFLGGN